jgi:hypothetical protein
VGASVIFSVALSVSVTVSVSVKDTVSDSGERCSLPSNVSLSTPLLIPGIVERKIFSYPPFVYITKIIFQSSDKENLDALCSQYSEQIRKIFGQRILGPEYPPIYRVKGMYQKQFILKLEKNISYSQAKKAIMQLNEEILSKQEFKKARVIVDVDPL